MPLHEPRSGVPQAGQLSLDDHSVTQNAQGFLALLEVRLRPLDGDRRRDTRGHMDKRRGAQTPLSKHLDPDRPGPQDHTQPTFSPSVRAGPTDALQRSYGVQSLVSRGHLGPGTHALTPKFQDVLGSCGCNEKPR